MKITISQSAILLEKALRKIVNFESENEKNDFILDVVNEYKQTLKNEMGEVDKFLEAVKASREKTMKEFDLLVIRRFKEMVEESSSPEMFKNFEKDTDMLKYTRGLNS